MEKILTTVGVLLGIGLVGYMYVDFLTNLKEQKATIQTQADDAGEVVADWVKGSASMEDLKDYSDQLVGIKTRLDMAEERKIAEERAKITGDYGVVHDGEIGGNIPVSLDASGTKDPEDDDMSFNWTSTDGKVNIEDRGAQKVEFNANPGSYNFELQVTDSYGASSTERRIVDVSEEPNDAPEIKITFN